MTMRSRLRRLDQFRRNHTREIGNWFFRQLGRDRYLIKDRIPAEQTQRILILRNNKRIGNMYFMLPFLHELRLAYPKATIDLMLIDRSQVAIFEHLGLNRVYVSDFSFGSIAAFLGTIRKCRKTVYDLLIMPHSSASDTLIGGLLHAKNKVAFHSERTACVFAHAVNQSPRSPHAALSALTLLEALGHTVSEKAEHTMRFTPQEIAHGERIVADLRGGAKHCFGYFRGARGLKIIADAHWLDVRAKFDAATTETTATQPTLQWVEILSPDIREPLVAGTPTFASADLRELAAVTRALDLFICGDTGPLHLADAAGARCVGLFTATDIKHYGCLGAQTVNVTDLDALNARSLLSTLGVHSAPSSGGAA
jgi:ADP-heptose:LPS heptosyltransferase